MAYSVPFYLVFNKLSSVWLCLFVGVCYIAIYAYGINRLYSNSFFIRTLRGRIVPYLNKRKLIKGF